VSTTINYTLVTEFIVQSEFAEQIAEALKILKIGISNGPHLFMTDYCEAEQITINPIFHKSNVYLCDFHHKQEYQGLL